MADETPTPAYTETIPGQAGGISAIASAHAPFIYFEGAPNYGYNNGIVNITLEALRYLPVGDKVMFDRVIVGHLRMSLQAATNLRGSLDAAIKLATPPANPSEVN